MTTPNAARGSTTSSAPVVVSASADTAQPLVSVVVICWNNRRFLQRCFESLLRTDYPNLECIMADNGSSDDSVQFVRDTFPAVKIIAHGANLGFAEGNNRAIRQARGDYIVTLNPDTEVEPNWITELVRVAESDVTVGMCSPKMYIMDHAPRLNSAGGDMLLRSGDNLSRAFYIDDDGRFNHNEETFGPSAGAGLYRRTMLDDIGLFDARLFTYYEDVDLNIRAQLRGYRCIYVPTSVVHHYQSGTLDDNNPIKQYLLHRNKWYVVLKTFPLSLLWRCKRQLASSWRGSMRHLRSVGFRNMPWRIFFAILGRLPRICIERLKLARRRTPDATDRIFAWMNRHEATYRELDQAAAVGRYYDDLKRRSDAHSAG